jgi:hypothetical protein
MRASSSPKRGKSAEATFTDFQEDYAAARDGVLRSMTPQKRAGAAGSLGMCLRRRQTASGNTLARWTFPKLS